GHTFHPVLHSDRLQHPPRSAFSAYSTLFRSMRPRRGGRAFAPDRSRLHWRTCRPSPATTCIFIARGFRTPSCGTSGAENTPSRPDRKSTRLNSSHVKISYAVFCLKKKNYNSV